MSSRQREQEKKGSADIKESTLFPDWDVFFFVASAYRRGHPHTPTHSGQSSQVEDSIDPGVSGQQWEHTWLWKLLTQMLNAAQVLWKELMADTKLDWEKVCAYVCVDTFIMVLVNLIDCTQTTWAFYSQNDSDEHFTDHKAEVMMDWRWTRLCKLILKCGHAAPGELYSKCWEDPFWCRLICPLRKDQVCVTINHLLRLFVRSTPSNPAGSISA